MTLELDSLFLTDGRPRSLRELVFPRPLNILVLAPHPGFDARVLQVNRQAAKALGTPLPYAEAFQLMRLGRPQ